MPSSNRGEVEAVERQSSKDSPTPNRTPSELELSAQKIRSKRPHFEQDSNFRQAMLLGEAETIGAGWRKVIKVVDRTRAVTATGRPARRGPISDCRWTNDGNLGPSTSASTGSFTDSAPIVDSPDDRERSIKPCGEAYRFLSMGIWRGSSCATSAFHAAFALGADIAQPAPSRQKASRLFWNNILFLQLKSCARKSGSAQDPSG